MTARSPASISESSNEFRDTPAFCAAFANSSYLFSGSRSPVCTFVSVDFFIPVYAPSPNISSNVIPVTSHSFLITSSGTHRVFPIIRFRIRM